MDKLVLSLVLSLLAGFLTAVGTFVKLVNDKESKVTEFRQQWTDSARQSLANLLSQLRYYCSLATELTTVASESDPLVKQLGKLADQNSEESTLLQSLLESQSKDREALMQALRDNREAIHSAYALAKLHFKPGDPEFLHVETKVDQALQLIVERNVSEGKSADALRAELVPLINELTTLSRGLLKGEWEKIKGGEYAYRQTRIWAKRGGLIGAGALTVLLGCFGVAALLNWKEASDKAMLANAATPAQAGFAASTRQNYAVPVAAAQAPNACADGSPTGITVVQQIASGGEDRSGIAATPVAIRPKARAKSSTCEVAGTSR